MLSKTNIKLSNEYVNMEQQSILDEQGKKHVQPLINIFVAVFLVFIFVIILDSLVRQYLGQLSLIAQGVIVVCFASAIYFMRDHIQAIINEYTKKR